MTHSAQTRANGGSGRYTSSRRHRCDECGAKAVTDDGYCFGCERVTGRKRHLATVKSAFEIGDIESLWNRCREPFNHQFDHKYLERQGDIEGHGLRLYQNRLAVPYRLFDGTLQTIQWIDAAGDKRYERGHVLDDSFFSVGDYKGTVHICEGPGTALVMHHVAKDYCVAAGSAGRLPRIAEVFRSKYPDAMIVICADNDRGKKQNVGLQKAKEAARAVGGFLAVPKLPGKTSVDFADVYIAKNGGTKKIRQLLRKAKLMEATQSLGGGTIDGIDVANAEETWLSDIGNSNRFSEIYEGRLAFVPELKIFLRRDEGTHWYEDAGCEVEFAKKYVTGLFEVGMSGNSDASRELRKFATSSANTNRIKAMLEQVRADHRIKRRISTFDSDPWLFPVENGVVDLKTGDFRPVEPSDNFLNVAPVVYDKDAKCPTWIRFLKRVQPDRDMRAYLQKLVGLSLVGKVLEEIMIFLFGVAGTGKSSFTGAITAVTGNKLAIKLTVKPLLAGSRGGNESEVVRLRGARIAVTSEVPEGKRFNEALLKDLSSRDLITARALYANPIEFAPSHTLWIYGNHRPILPSDDTGVWRRLKLVPFEQVIPNEEMIKDLDSQLLAEGAGILNWMIRGCLRWQKDSVLTPPQTVQTATEDYKSDMDVLAGFLTDCTKMVKDARVGASELYKAYKTYSLDAGDRPITSTAFGIALKQRSIRKVRSARGYIYFGLKLKEQ